MTTRANSLSELFDQQRNRLAILLVLFVGVYFMVAFGEQAWRARQLQAEASSLSTAIAKIERGNQSLQAELDSYSNDSYTAYVEARARRDLNLANPDETVLLIHWQNPPPPAVQQSMAPTKRTDEPNWRRWLDIFSGH
ncbi:MAG: septum formation initiator family protein [Thermomicrobiales bacterium]